MHVHVPNDKINAAREERRTEIYRQICGDEEVDNPPASEECRDKLNAARRDDPDIERALR